METVDCMGKNTKLCMSSDELCVMGSIVAWASALTAAFSLNLLC